MVADFQSDLIAYRTAVLEGAPKGWEHNLISEVLNRWQQHAGRDAIWNDIVEALPLAPPPAIFVAAVLRSRLETERLNRDANEFTEVERRLKVSIKRDATNGKHIIAGAKKEMLAAFIQDRNDVLGREKDNAHRKRFSLLWSEHFRQHCGRPMDEAVRVLTEIAFGDEVTIDAIRALQKPMKRRDRATGRKK